MIVTIMSSEKITSITLPPKVTGQYWIQSDEGGSAIRLASIEGVNEEWVLRPNRKVMLTIRNPDGREVQYKSLRLKPITIHSLITQDGDRFAVFAEPVTEDRKTFTKYLVGAGSTTGTGPNVDLTIGRNEYHDIRYVNGTASGDHAKISRRNGKWYIRDGVKLENRSTNGTFVNGRMIRECELRAGDCVFIMGLKIVVGYNFLALNNPDGRVTLSNKLRPFLSEPVQPIDEEEEYELPPHDFFYCSPRFKRDIETAVFKIDSPPQSPIGEELPWPLVLGSSMAMGMMSMMNLTNGIINGNTTAIIMGGSMLAGTLMIPLITKIYERNRKRKKEDLRQKKFRAYLNRVAVQINEACQLQEEILNENIITVEECQDRIREVRRNLWERSMGQNDFLRLRLGWGEGRLDADFRYQERKFSLDDDNLQEELYSLCESPKVLHNIPISYSLFDNYVSGIIGPRKQVLEFTRGLIIQLAALYSYEEVKLVFLFDPEELPVFDFVRWLPHVWSEDKRFRFLATNSNEVKEVSAWMENVISERQEINENDMEDVSPYYVIFSMSKELAARAEMLKELLAKKENIHFSLVTVYDELRNLPKECSMVVELDNGRGRLFDKNDITGQYTDFTPDIALAQDPRPLSVQLANTPLNNLATNFQLPRMITFLEMFGVGKVEHLNALSRWKENDPTKSLQAAVGVDTLGDIFKLDLHEKFHGPHGLVAGMTGSGKSEFIITYILSLAVNYHPNEVAFILIDYKGGGMAKSFENLPHTAGIITNLDGGAIKRSLVSIESELKRRQAIFAETSKKVGVSNIDIYKYQKLYRAGTVTEPLQHLFIISDEFAELKTQQPEFMTQLVSAARIGRSLGVHLILATQKPSGVVDDQIWSNSKFRVCLKVQERSDSMDMLKRPDAAELVETGRFYLQVGYNELFELGQSAWSGAPYYPSDRVQKEKDDSVVVIDTNGHPIRDVKLDHRRARFADAKKQLDVITDYLRGIAEADHIKIRPLWLEPIPAVILLEEVRRKYGAASRRFVLNPVIGEYDDPAHQQQCILRLPISTEGNAVIYGVAGSGKTSFLNAMVCSLILEHTPDEVNLYLLDFASETLRAFAKAPHVGEVILAYEAEKISNLFKMLRTEAERRKKLFADFGGDYASYIRTSGQTLPNIVVAINNYAAFSETYEEKEEAVSFLSREGTKYGIYFVLTALSAGSVRFRLLQNFKQQLVLQLNDEADYSTIVGKTEGLYPARFKGRGLIRTDALYEFQVASLVQDGLPFTWIQELCAKTRAGWHGACARKVPILPEHVNIDFLKDYIRPDAPLSIPVGVEKNTLNVHAYPFGASFITMVCAGGPDYQPFLADLAVLAGTQIGLSGVIFDLPDAVRADTGTIRRAAAMKDCEREVDRLFELTVYRNNTYKEAQEKGESCEEFPVELIFINSLASLRDTLNETLNQKLSLILEKGTLTYRMAVVIGEQAKQIPSFSYEKWYKNKVSASDGIWVGSGITEQYQMKASKTTAEMHEEIPPEFGFSLIKGRAVKLKLLNERPEEDSDE